ncbi:MAG: peptidylprolyl isomerase [Planctomycetes bacterium]|nr:peptidylprolyl isomerase [Planctomycetota bacterium]
MDLRIISASLLLSAFTVAPAQSGATPPPAATKPAPTPDQAATGAAQDPQPQEAPKPAVQEPTPAEQIAQLRAEKERLQREIEYAKDRASHASAMLAEKLGQRGQNFGSIDAGTNQPARPAAMEMKKARVFNDEERGTYGDAVMLVVDGMPVQQAEFDSLMGYMKELTNSGTDEMRAQRILFELIRTASVAAAFPDTDAETKAAAVANELKDGADIAALIEKNSAVLGAQEDGAIVVTRNSFLGSKLEQVAFGLGEGKTSAPFRNVFGFVVLRADGMEKGSSPELDKVNAHAVQVRYVADQDRLNQAQAKASRGQVDVVVRDDEVLALLPAMYRPQPQVPVEAVDPRQQIGKQIEILKMRLKALGSDGDVSPTKKTEMAALEKQIQELQSALSDMPAKTDIDIPGKNVKGDLKQPPAPDAAGGKQIPSDLPIPGAAPAPVKKK